MNNFEKHLKANKEKLDLDQVNPEIWLNIENQVLKRKQRRTVFFLKLAGAAAAVLFIGIIALNIFYQKENRDIHAQLIELYGLQQYNFPQRIEAQKAALEKMRIPKDRAEDFQILINQLKLLDQQYYQYLQYIDQHGYQEFIGEQITSYYNSKIELLEKIKTEIKKFESYENKYDEDDPTIELNI